MSPGVTGREACPYLEVGRPRPGEGSAFPAASQLLIHSSTHSLTRSGISTFLLDDGPHSGEQLILPLLRKVNRNYG